jgi:hypothetical protein
MKAGKEGVMKRIVGSIAAAALTVVIGGSAPAHAASPGASCVGQALSVYGPAFGADLGEQISLEARDPEAFLGTVNLGAWTAGFAQADRADCPEE